MQRSTVSVADCSTDSWARGGTGCQASVSIALMRVNSSACWARRVAASTAPSTTTRMTPISASGYQIWRGWDNTRSATPPARRLTTPKITPPAKRRVTVFLARRRPLSSPVMAATRPMATPSEAPIIADVCSDHHAAETPNPSSDSGPTHTVPSPGRTTLNSILTGAGEPLSVNGSTKSRPSLSPVTDARGPSSARVREKYELPSAKKLHISR